MLICTIKPSDGHGNLKMLCELLHDADKNCLDVGRLCCVAPTVFTSYSPIEIYANETPRALLTALLLSPAAT